MVGLPTRLREFNSPDMSDEEREARRILQPLLNEAAQEIDRLRTEWSRTTSRLMNEIEMIQRERDRYVGEQKKL